MRGAPTCCASSLNENEADHDEGHAADLYDVNGLSEDKEPHDYPRDRPMYPTRSALPGPYRWCSPRDRVPQD